VVTGNADQAPPGAPQPHQRIPASRIETQVKANGRVLTPCWLAYEVPLATLNLKDYEDFKEYHGLRIPGTE